ncbi:U32 family peptidase [Echinimonas agarilytica]|uniref:Ubiquinone biosynthesis protein UbiV n=1 Tax=Echinimonas agarilytica TaxID=1215918 RepID=A0AA41W863_9GAMM|nr:U32 family peptidase [Echinimonas agarilytica]MCM2680749.1 U32 family peptidase [Echinimonas agarilytica]
MKLSVGPIQFYWPKATIEQFYTEVAQSSVELVYVGETVCAKRNELKPSEWLGLAQDLARSGKQVVLSTLALVECSQELLMMKPFFENGEFTIEANDMSAVQLAKEYKLPFVAGPSLNCYNVSALQRLMRAGMVRWVMPVELSRDWLCNTLSDAEEQGVRGDFEVEVLGYGHLPLAYSARCFTARSENKPKDQCKKCCIEYPQGRTVDSLEGQRLFTLNGIQTMSGDIYDLRPEMASMNGIVDYFRLSPSDFSFKRLLTEVHAIQNSPNSIVTANHTNNGYWHQIAGIKTQKL